MHPMRPKLGDPSRSLVLEPAGFGVRLLACVYESLIVGAILLVATAAAMIVTRATIAPNTPALQLWLLCVLYGYFGYCYTRSGQSVGMKAWRLLLTDAQGQRLGWAHAGWRWIISSVLGFGVLGLLAMWLDRDGLALQDRLSKTRVLRLPKS
jgi:uncharacterized RDD family membrane protein YckC